MPKDYERTRFTAIELDNISSRILKQLYQKEQVYNQGYEETELPNDFYDVAISNVPFGNYPIYDNHYKDKSFRVHDYFFVKSLDKVRTGGVIAFITYKGTMDKTNSEIREYIAERANFLGAIRLPNITFRKVANTDVVADIIFLQKTDKGETNNRSWINAENIFEDVYMNQYFVEHPEMIMGKVKKDMGQYRDIVNITLDKEENLEQMLSEAINYLPSDIYESIEKDENEEDYIIAPNDIKNNCYAVIDDKIYYKENAIMKLVDKKAITKDRIRGMIQIRDALDELIDIQGQTIEDDKIKPYQAKLNKLYDNFVKKYGIINNRANKLAFEEDSEYQLISALENINEETKEVVKADIFFQRTIEPKKVIEHVETSNEALIVSLNQKGYVDLKYMSSLSDKDYETLIGELKGKIYRNPLIEEEENSSIEEGWETAEEYLSGDVVEKLSIAEAKAEENLMYLDNVMALREVQPVRLEASDIQVKLGTTWIPEYYVEQFAKEKFNLYDDDIVIKYNQYLSKWIIEKKPYYTNIEMNEIFGTKRVNAIDVLEATLN